MSNENLRKAQKAKNDEFFTLYNDIEAELVHYKEYLKDKIIYCNCDQPSSNFVKFLNNVKEEWGIKDVWHTSIQEGISYDSPQAKEMLAKCDVVISNPPFSCYSDDTEVMTDSGWKLFRDVDINTDLIMSLNPTNKNIEMVRATDFIKKQVNEDMFNFVSIRHDLLVTADHKMIVNNKKNKTIEFKEAKEVESNDRFPIHGFVWKGIEQEYFILPSVKQTQQYTNKEIIVPEKQIPMKDWLEFFGFWLADGCCRDHINSCGKRDYSISIKQNVDNEKYVLSLFDKIGFKPYISKVFENNKRNYNVYSKQLWTYLNQFGKSRDKYIPREFMNLDTKYLIHLYEGYTNGDSSLCKSGQTHFSSVSKRLMDDIQELLLKVKRRITPVASRTMKHSYDNNYCTIYEINVKVDNNKNINSIYNQINKKTYCGFVYCLSLEKNHIMLVRRNGKSAWCGNCSRAEYIPLLMQSGKQFLFIDNLNMATYKEVFPLIRDGKIWCGYTFPKSFMQPDGTQKKFGNIVWWTNMVVKKEFKLDPNVKYYGNENKYPRYDNYDAINVDRLKDIPSDYPYVMGVPITFIQSYTPPRMTGTAFGSLASAKAQTDKTSEQMANTTICDTLLDCRNDLITDGGGTIFVQTSACSNYSDTNMTQTAKTSDSLKSTAEAFTRGFSSTAFELIGVDESCGSGLGGVRDYPTQ